MDIVHVPGRRPFGQNLVTIYVDGEQRMTAQLRFPSLNEVREREGVREKGRNRGAVGNVGVGFTEVMGRETEVMIEINLIELNECK